VSGRVYILRQAWGGFAGNEHTVSEWVMQVLRDQDDVPRKLADHPDVAERHSSRRGGATLIPTWRSDTRSSGPHLPATWRCSCSLSRPMSTPSPVTAPTLPEVVTHVWVAGRSRSKRAGLVSRPRLVADSMEVASGRLGNAERRGELLALRELAWTPADAPIVRWSGRPSHRHAVRSPRESSRTRGPSEHPPRLQAVKEVTQSRGTL
jgi:hypothetical protein